MFLQGSTAPRNSTRELLHRDLGAVAAQALLQRPASASCGGVPGTRGPRHTCSSTSLRMAVPRGDRDCGRFRRCRGQYGPRGR